MPSDISLEIIDDFAPADLFHEAAKLGAAKGWYFGHGSNDSEVSPFWKIDLEGIHVFDSIWNHARGKCETLACAPLTVLRQYGNGHTYGLGGKPHLDDHRPGSWTLLYYPMPEWRDEWEGETVFYDRHGEIAHSVRPRPNRAVFFDSRILHAGRAPGRQCPALRVTVAYKLVEQTPTPASEGPERHQTIHIPATRIQQLTAEHLATLSQSLRLPGFRPGHIPMPVIEQRYGADARTKVMERLIREAAAAVPDGSIVTHVDVKGDDAATLDLTVLCLRDLPDVAALTLERLTGLSPEAMEDHLNQQILDHLELTCRFRTPESLVEREFAAITRAALAADHDPQSLAVEFRPLAERRVRLGMVVAELARRYEIKGPDLERQVLDRLRAQAQIHERPATAGELRDLA